MKNVEIKICMVIKGLGFETVQNGAPELKTIYCMGIQDHLTCLLRNLYVGQEATVRTGHGNNRQVPNQEKSMSRLYIATLLI